ncbi:MAG: hypothetical protein WC773_01810 [Patescibacteria group bacterium]
MVVTIGIFVGFAILTGSAHASTQPLFLNPTTAEISLAQGGFQNQVVRIINQTTSTVNLNATVTGAAPDQASGDLKLASENSTNTIQANKSETLPYITVSNPKITINASQKGEVNYSVYVPKSAKPGSYYGAMQFGVGDAAFIRLTVYNPNQTVASVTPSITNFSLSRVALTPTLKLSATISNPTTTAIRPSGNVTFYNYKNNEVGITAISSSGKMLYPDNTGSYSTKWRGSGLMFGRYTAKLTIFSVNGFPAMYSERVIWILPWWLMGAIVLVCFAIIRFRRSIWNGIKHLFRKALSTKHQIRNKLKAHKF